MRRPTLRELPAADRPRERLAALGPRALALRELVAILVGSGSAAGSVLEVADRVLSWPGEGEGPRPGDPLRSLRPLPRLAGRGVAELSGIPGVGPATAARIVASVELGRRVDAEPGPDRVRIRGPEDVHRRLGPLLRDLRQEEFHALLLDAQHRVLRDVVVTRGILDASLIHPREVFRAAILESAAAVILVHNHPSGDPTPSAEDRAVTRQLADSGRALGIPVLDHVIVGDGRWASVSEPT